MRIQVAELGNWCKLEWLDGVYPQFGDILYLEWGEQYAYVSNFGKIIQYAPVDSSNFLPMGTKLYGDVFDQSFGVKDVV